MELTVDIFSKLLAAIALSAARLVGFVSVFPAFSIVQLPASVRFGVAFAIALPLMPVTFFWLVDSELSIFSLTAIGLREGIVGAGIGLLCGIPIWAASGAGDVVDLYRGADSQGLFNPALEEEGSPTGIFLSVATLLAFVFIGGIGIVFQIVYASYEAWPIWVELPSLSITGTDAVLKSLDWLSRLMLVLAAPFLIAMFLAEFAAGLASRSARRFGNLDLSLILKTLVYLILFPGFIMFFAESLLRPFSEIEKLGTTLEVFLK